MIESELKQMLLDTLWMARRYANGRRTYATSTVNETIDHALKLGIPVEPDGSNGEMYAEDGSFGKWNPKTKTFAKETNGEIL